MNSNYKTDNRWPDKVAFLTLFVAGIIIAHFIVAHRSMVEFSRPVELDYMGVAVSMPLGNGWESDKQWKYEESSFIISGFFRIESPNPMATAQCRYLLASAEVEPESQIEEKAHTVKGAVAEKGVLGDGPVEVSWALITAKDEGVKSTPSMFFGTASLANGRVINIEVRWSEGEKEMAWQVFARIAKGIERKESPLLDCGIGIVTQAKAVGFGKLLIERSERSYFLVKDMQGQPAGYIIDVKADLGSEPRMNIQAASSLYLQGRRGREQVTLFQGKDDLSEFVWKNESVSRFGRSGTEGVFDKAGTLAVREYGTFIFGGSRPEEGSEPFEEKFYRPGPAAVPDVLGDLVYGLLLDSRCEKVLMDIIRADGTIVPVLVSRMDIDKDETDKNIAYAMKVDFLDSSNSYSQVYLDSQRRVLREVVRYGEAYVLQRSDQNELIKIFPEKSGEILQPADSGKF